MILHDILTDCNLYHRFFEEKLWRHLIPFLRCRDYRDDDRCNIIGWGTRSRKPKGNNENDVTEYLIKRLRCKTHVHTISIIPAFLLPRIHYIASIVNGFVDRYMKGEGTASLVRDTDLPEEKTIQRWIQKITCNINNVKKKVMSLLTDGFYTFDEILVIDQKEEYRNSGRSPQLITLWALLKSVAIRLSEGRVPYHYAIMHPP